MKFVFLLPLFILIVCKTNAQPKRDAKYYYFEGEQALEDNKFVMALAHYNECLRIDPYFMEAYKSRAAVKESMGDIKGALTDYSIYVDSKPGNSDALFSRAVLRYKLGQYAPARSDFLEFLKLPAGETNKVVFRQGAEGTDKVFTQQGSNHGEVFNYLGLIETKLKNYKLAMTYVDSAVHLDPGEALYRVNRGIVKEHMMDTTGALEDYQKALQIDPANGNAIHNLAVIKRSRGEQNESEKMLERAIEQSPSLPYPYSARAYYRFNHKNLKGALEDYDKVIQLNKTDEEAWLYRGMVKEKLKDDDGAFIDYTEAITLKIDYARAWLIRGNLLNRLNRQKDAIEDYTVAITWYPEYGSAFLNRAITEERLGKKKEACEDLLQAEKLRIMIPPAIRSKCCQ